MKIKVDKQPTLLDILPSNEMVKEPAINKQFLISRSTHFSHIKQGLMPSGISLGARAVGYLKYEHNIILKARISGQTPEQIKALVKDLEAKRKDF